MPHNQAISPGAVRESAAQEAGQRSYAIESRGSKGQVTSPHILASVEGRRVLASGGNAIEAVIAMGAVLAVVYPHFNSLGGDAVWLVADENGKSRCFMAIGQAALDTAGYEDGIAARGPRSAATSACLVDGWGHAHGFAQMWGNRLSFSQLLEPAIALAQNGFPVSQSQMFWLDFRKKDWPSWPGFAAAFDTNGLGSRDFVQPQLAASLRAIAERGAREFYEGALASRIADGLRDAGSPLRLADLAATRTLECEPLALNYAGHTLLAPPPPTQGVTTLMIMGILEHLGIGTVAEGSAEFFHLIVEAIKQAFLLRGGISDPAFCLQPVDTWLSPAGLQAMASRVDQSRAMPWQEPFQTGDTVYLAATDAQGRCASVLQSTYFDWGSGVVAGDTGILWQNRAAAFTAGSNALRPGARPFYTLNPGIALKGGRPRILYGTQGADGQPQTLATLLTRIIDFEFGPAAALAAPRFLLGRTFSDNNDTLKIEQDVPADVLTELSRRGHRTASLPAASPLSGQAGIIVIDDGVARGAHDPRSDGVALTVE
ncbi:gamma-glutamyltransferase family protein [Mesorhizobium sp. CO1-1-8]|uniref:gamma-glutamyltransferase family protein n=1 Tax=Mesorhizobium sp. CO1-1-8 TaxID=2876631 RepID=UPI001CD1301A|nr:gamma-glutamyltransferase [Mesorhizobium sp. CO1-1-8]MBZ9772585.1 gamma-glutamyltransferase [Mesorhizobium sp. CO1-1-8]